MKTIYNFLSDMINDERELATLNVLGEKLVGFSFKDVKRKIKEMGVKYIIDTYNEEIIFKANDDKVYQLGVI